MKKIFLSLFMISVMLVMSVSVMAVTCPSGTTPIYVETINVDASQSTAVSTSTLENGATYLLEASGIANAGDTIDFDAQYSITNRITSDTWTDTVSGYVSYGPRLLDLLVDGTDGLWGTYNPTHTYSLAMLGTGTPVELLIYDICYPNNVGSLTVDIDKCVDITAPIVTIESPTDGNIVDGIVDIYGSIIEDYELSHYNIAIYPSNADFMDFSQRLEQQTVSQSSGFGNELIYQWDTTSYDNGEYLIRLAARDKAGNRDISGDPYLGGDDSQHVIKVIVINNKIVHGGGHMLEEVGDKRKDWLDISFGGFIGNAGNAGLVGEWQINFHNVNTPSIDKSRFHTTEITHLNFFAGNMVTCTEAMNFYANGELNGVPGYRIIFRAGDSSEPSSYDTDTVRVTLYGPDGFVFDSSDKARGEFLSTSDCVGNARTGLDTGNIIIQG